jgi:hypothetical protein
MHAEMPSSCLHCVDVDNCTFHLNGLRAGSKDLSLGLGDLCDFCCYGGVRLISQILAYHGPSQRVFSQGCTTLLNDLDRRGDWPGWRVDGNHCLGHYFSASDTSTFVFLANVVDYLLDCLHEPVRLAITRAIEVIAIQLIFAASELLQLHSCWFVAMAMALLFFPFLLGWSTSL